MNDLTTTTKAIPLFKQCVIRRRDRTVDGAGGQIYLLVTRAPDKEVHKRTKTQMQSDLT